MSLSWIVRGGPAMVPLLAFSVLALAVFIERFIRLHSSQVISKPLVQALEERRALQDVNFLIQRDHSVLSRFLKRLLEKSTEPREVLDELAHSYFKKVWSELEHNLEILNVIATTSPLLGLLGTVLGMVSIFDALAHSGAGNALVLSKGIAEALITTITGLVVAMPALIAYAYFSKKIERYLLTFEECGKLYLAQIKSINPYQRVLF